jgi:glutamyl-tRNA synthetase
MASERIRVRFAPSPTGHLHLGNVRTALFNWLYARNRGGTFVLRLEDTDAARSTEESVRSVLQDLRWLGLHWDEGPETEGPFGPYRQTERYATYREAAQRLLREDRAYPCFCSQAELDAGREAARSAQRTYVYPGTCRHLDPAERARKIEAGVPPFSIRLKVPLKTVTFTDLVRGPVSIHTSQFGDWILARPDGSPTYNFAVVVDDSLMGVTHVIRGEDHLSNTPKQIVLYEALGLEPPPFGHLSMILGPDGGKLSKRHGDVSLDAFRSRGFLPQVMVNGLALLGWSDPDGREVLSIDEIIGAFSLERVNRVAAVFDEGKLRYLNREHIKRLPPEALAEALAPRLREAGRLPGGDLSAEVRVWLADLGQLLAERMDLLSEAAAASDPVFVFEPGAMDEATRISLEAPGAGEVVRAFLKESGAVDLAAPGAYRQAVLAVRDGLKVKGKALFHPIRAALTARDSGPDLERLVPLLERGSRLGLPAPVLPPAERIRRVLHLLS